MMWGRSTRLALGALLVLCGCQTTPRSPAPGELPRAGQYIPFRPAFVTSKLHFADGPYPALFAGESTAMWLNVEPLAPPLGGFGQMEPLEPVPPPPASFITPAMEGRFVMFDCQLTSMFADMSIAYDVVGLSGVEVYLLTPSGRRVPPAQVEMGKHLVESQHGTLRQYTRTNRITFPSAEAELQIPAAGATGAPLRLVLEGYGCVFYFEWTPAIPEVLGPPAFSQREGVQAGRAQVQRLRQRALDISHTFD